MCRFLYSRKLIYQSSYSSTDFGRRHFLWHRFLLRGIRYYTYSDFRHFSWNGATQLVLFRHGSILLDFLLLNTSFIFLLAIVSFHDTDFLYFISVAAAAHLAAFILSLLDNTGTGRNLEISWVYFLLYSTLSILHFEECFSHVIREKNTVRIATPDTHRRWDWWNAVGAPIQNIRSS